MPPPLPKLLNRAPEHCQQLLQQPQLVEGLRQLLRGPCRALAATAAAALLRLLRYGCSEGVLGDVREAQRLVAQLAEEKLDVEHRSWMSQ